MEWQSNINNIGNVKNIVLAILCMCLVYIVIQLFELKIAAGISNSALKFLGLVGRRNKRKEQKYSRAVAIGTINEKHLDSKVYKFLNDLIIDLGEKRKGATPYSFLWLVLLCSFLISLSISLLVFSNWYLTFLLYPIVVMGAFCFLYTRANITHDKRIAAVMEAENIICGNIKGGVLSAVKLGIHNFAPEVKPEFQVFIDNIELKNYHMKTAMIELNNNLGSVFDDFAKKCIMFDLEEEHGLVDIFKDVVEVNNIKSRLRLMMKLEFESIFKRFVAGASCVFIVLILFIVIYEILKIFYFKMWIGNIILCTDILLFTSAFVYLTYLRARDLK